MFLKTAYLLTILSSTALFSQNAASVNWVERGSDASQAGSTDSQKAELYAQGSDRLCRFSWQAGTYARITVGLPEEQHSGAVQSVRFTPNGRFLITAGLDGDIRIWDTQERKLDRVLSTDSAIFSSAVSPDGRFLATGNRSGSVYIWNLNSRQPINRRQIHEGVVHSVAFSPDSTTLASAGDDKKVNLWNSASGDLQRNLPSEQAVKSIVFISDGQTLLEGGFERYIGVWNWRNSTLVRRINGSYPTLINTIAASKRSSLFAFVADNLAPTGTNSTNSRNIIRVRDLSNGRERSFSGHSDYVETLAFSPDDTQLLSGSLDGTVRLWNLSENRKMQEISLGSTVLSVDFDGSCSRFSVGTRSGSIFIYRSD